MCKGFGSEQGPQHHFVGETENRERVCKRPGVEVLHWSRAGRAHGCLQSVLSLSLSEGGGDARLKCQNQWLSWEESCVEQSEDESPGSEQALCRIEVHFDIGIAAVLRRCPAVCPGSGMNQERLAVLTNRPTSAGLHTANLHALTMRRLAGVAARVPSWASHLQE